MNMTRIGSIESLSFSLSYYEGIHSPCHPKPELTYVYSTGCMSYMLDTFKVLMLQVLMLPLKEEAPPNMYLILVTLDTLQVLMLPLKEEAL